MSLTLFRFIGDVMHFAAFVILILKINKTRSASGISFKTQALLLLVFATRYLDLFHFFSDKHRSYYNALFKLAFLGVTGYICYAMKVRFKASWNPGLDVVPVHFILGPCAVLALLFTHKYTITEVFWTFSIILESVAIFPQLYQIAKANEAETITSHYLFALGAYRGFYILNWVWRYFNEGHFDLLATFFGLIQTGLYADFFYIYFTRVLKGQRFELPI